MIYHLLSSVKKVFSVWWPCWRLVVVVSAVLQCCIGAGLEQCQHSHWSTVWWGSSLSTISSRPTSSNLTLILRPTCQCAVFVLICSHPGCCRTQLTASNRPSPSYSVWSDQGLIIENWTKWRLYLHQAGGEQTIVYPQSFIQLKPQVTTTKIN